MRQVPPDQLHEADQGFHLAHRLANSIVRRLHATRVDHHATVFRMENGIGAVRPDEASDRLKEINIFPDPCVGQIKLENPFRVSKFDFTNIDLPPGDQRLAAPEVEGNSVTRRRQGRRSPASAPSRARPEASVPRWLQAEWNESDLSMRRTWTRWSSFPPETRYGVNLGADSPVRKFITVMTAGRKTPHSHSIVPGGLEVTS